MKPDLVACHECDMLQRVGSVPRGGAARCLRCGGLLFHHRAGGLQSTLALTLAAMFLFIMANANPIMMVKLEGQSQSTTLINGVRVLFQQGMWVLSLVVLLTSILVPLAQICGLLYVLLPLSLNRIPPGVATVFRMVNRMQPWGMMEVFLLGTLISIVKLAKMADIVPGLALYSLGALIFVVAASTASLDAHEIWERLEARR